MPCLHSFGGGSEQVARVTMCTEWEKGGRGVVCIPLKTMAMYMAFLAKLRNRGPHVIAVREVLDWL